MQSIFVFGSNLAGRHGAGAARTAAKYYGAQYGVGVGLTGNSYAIPTKGFAMEVLCPDQIERYVGDFIRFAEENPDLSFTVTRVGCGLAGNIPATIAPMFKSAPDNCLFDTAWKQWLPDKKFWGTY